MNNLTQVDWSKIPPPEDDGGVAHLTGLAVPDQVLASTDGNQINLSQLEGLTLVYAYPRTGRPDQALPDGWDMIPGARGCTPQSCAFRDHADELRQLGISSLFGLSTQETEYQKEAAERMHLPFALLSDAELRLTQAMSLPTFDVDGMTLVKRLTMILQDGIVKKIFYPVFPPDQNAGDVITWLKDTKGPSNQEK